MVLGGQQGPDATRKGSRRGDLGLIARAGFQNLTSARDGLAELAVALEITPAGETLTEHPGAGVLREQDVLSGFAEAADADAALSIMLRLAQHPSRPLAHVGPTEWQRLCRLLGASPGLGHFFERHPQLLAGVLARGGRLPSAAEATNEMLAAVGAVRANLEDDSSVLRATVAGEAGWIALRVKYRELLADIMLYDLSNPAVEVCERVTAAISHIADAAIEAALAVARVTLESESSTTPFARERVDAVRLAVIAMGKCGAEELNVVSDVDVLFVAEGEERIATALARETMRAIHNPTSELPLWQLDANLRPEGQHGALVRTLPSMMGYYERWAKTWEFQALIKARPCAGDREIGAEFVARTRALVWDSGRREDFVGSVQRMRERVTEHIAPEDLDYQIKLGPGGLRDIEFSVQLLQLVHGQYDERLHLRGTLPALRALVDGGYVARADGERLSEHYRVLRVLEHRVQLRDLRRTALLPRDTDELRVLARASGLATTAEQLSAIWNRVRREVRELHLKIFYAPLLSAVAALPEEEFVLGSDEARARLASIGFADPDGAFRHLAALTGGSSRAARIMRNLSPVLLQWFSAGTDPDYGLLSFRKVSEANKNASWYLRLLRDGSLAAERLAHVLANSRFAADLLESNPEGVAWLERDELMQPVSTGVLLGEMNSLVSRRPTISDAARQLRSVHRREILRLAMGRLVGVLSDQDVAIGLDAAHSALLETLLGQLLLEEGSPEITFIGMGRFGGRELGFASDIDLMAVSRSGASTSGAGSNSPASRIVIELRTLVADPRFAVDLDFDLRPEGKNGPLVRSIDAYRAYYDRWSATWEAQALLRARHAAGSTELSGAFFEMADPIRYPKTFPEEQLREVRRIKARVEGERLPRGADPTMHLKLGPGGLSDVEWLVQLLQLQHGAAHPELRTVSTLDALEAAVNLKLLSYDDAQDLRAAWEFASTVRSALRLWNGRVSDLLPTDLRDLAGVAGVLKLPRDRTSEIVERWLLLSRRARKVFEREFFGYSHDDPYAIAFR